jgi:hypothetical protein
MGTMPGLTQRNRIALRLKDQIPDLRFAASGMTISLLCHSSLELESNPS